MTESTGLVGVEREAETAAAVITIQRPEKKNALSIAVRDAISDALDELAEDPDTKVVVVTGQGDVFSAGFDLREFEQPELADELWASSDRFHRRVLEFPLPTVAAVNGPALAGGFDLAVMCDLRIASTAARFSHPESTFSQTVYGPLKDLVGGAVARDLCFTGRSVDAEEALALHVVTKVVAPERLMEEAMATAAAIARTPRDVLLVMKAKVLRLLRSGGVQVGTDLGATLDL
ncbi:MAG TPA: enoyl-CoA hydratase/isomerase family protein [Acidimicrobiales bacterium]|nr:enoyl-CoA hydratase/isomerase family protein [Acidimicrobiales bacterium]